MSKNGPMQGGQVELVEAILDGWQVDTVLGEPPRLLVTLNRGDYLRGYQSVWLG